MKRDWVQILSNFGVLLGLGLLIFELNQSSDLTQAQVVDGTYDAVVFRNLALLGESPEQALARSIFRPDELTEDDVIVLSQFYTAMLVSWMRVRDERGVGYFGSSFEYVARSEAYFLNTRPGRAWWASVRQITDPAIVQAVDEALASMNPDDHRALLERMIGAQGGDPAADRDETPAVR